MTEDQNDRLTDEFAAYMRMRAKRYLQRVRSTIHTIAQLESEIAELESMMDGVKAVDYSRDKVSAPANDDGMVNAIARMDSLRAEYRSELDEHLQVKADAHRALKSVRQPWRAVLTYRYLHGMAWADVTAALRGDGQAYAEDYVRKEMHDNGLLEFYVEYMREHDEFPDAM